MAASSSTINELTDESTCQLTDESEHQLIERMDFPLIRESYYFLLDSNDGYKKDEPNYISGNKPMKSYFGRIWIGSGGMNGCHFFIAYDNKNPYTNFLIMHVVPTQCEPKPRRKYDNVVLITSSNSEMVDYERIKEYAKESYVHLNVDIENRERPHIFVYFNRYTGELCIVGNNQLYMSSKPLFVETPEAIKYMNSLFSSETFNCESTSPSLFSSYKISSYANEIVAAKTFQEKKDIAIKAFSEAPPDSNDIVKEFYQRLINSASADEFMKNSQPHSSKWFEKFRGSNANRTLDKYVKPSMEACRTTFIASFNGAPVAGMHHR